MKYVYGRKKWLAAGIAALLISGTGAVSDVLAAPVYTSGITTKAKKDKATFGSAYKVENGVNKYNLEDGSKISIHGTYHAEGITPGKGTTSVVTVGDGTGTLSIDTSSSEAGNSQGAGILASDGSRLTINGNLQIKTYGGSCFADGIYMMRAGTGTGAKANITVNGNVYIGDPAAVGEPPDSSSRDAKWGVNAAEIHGGYGPDGHVPGWADEYTGARWQPTGVDVDMSDGSSIDLNGDVYLAVRGAAMKTDPYYKSAGMDDYDIAVINANKGNVTIVTPSSTGESFYSLASYGGTINVNMAGADAASHKVNIKGNIIAMRDDKDHNGQPYFFQNGRINLALANSDSQWIGVVDNSGSDQAGEVNLWLQNGAVWKHSSPSRTNGLQVEKMPQPSVFHYGKYDGVSHVNQLVGGNRGGGGSKGRKAPAAKSSEAKINDAAEPVEMPDEEINEKAAEEKPEPQDRADKKETADTAGMSASDAAAGNEGMNTQGDGSGSGGETGDGDGTGTGDGSGTGTGEGDGNGSGPGAGVPITPPTVINKVLPVYPPSAKMKETTGITYVTILVNASGTVDSAYVAQGSGSSVLDAAAIDAAYQWTFSPALDKYGVPVPCRITFPVEFRLN